MIVCIKDESSNGSPTPNIMTTNHKSLFAQEMTADGLKRSSISKFYLSNINSSLSPSKPYSKPVQFIPDSDEKSPLSTRNSVKINQCKLYLMKV